MSKIQHHYDSFAANYDARYDENHGKQYYSHICSHVISYLPRKGHILDLGCGTGLFGKRIIERGGNLAGIDISRGMLNQAENRCPEGDFLLGDVEALPYDEGTFDAVTSILAFSYFRNPEIVLQEVMRVLKPGGPLVICTLGKNLFTRAVPAYYKFGEKVGIKKIGVGDFDERYYTTAELVGLFRDAGLSEISYRRCSFAHINLSEPVYSLFRKMEPFVESHMPHFAYNICIKGTKK